MYIFAYAFWCMYVYVRVFICLHMFMCMYCYVRVRTHVCLCVSVCACVCTCMPLRACACVRMYSHGIICIGFILSHPLSLHTPVRLQPLMQTSTRKRKDSQATSICAKEHCTYSTQTNRIYDTSASMCAKEHCTHSTRTNLTYDAYASICAEEAGTCSSQIHLMRHHQHSSHSPQQIHSPQVAIATRFHQDATASPTPATCTQQLCATATTRACTTSCPTKTHAAQFSSPPCCHTTYCCPATIRRDALESMLRASDECCKMRSSDIAAGSST